MEPFIDQAAVQPAPAAEHVHYERRRPEETTLHQIIQRVMKLLTRLGYLLEEQDMIFMAETDTTALGPLQSAACTYRIAFGPRAGQKVLSLQSVPRYEVQPTDDQRCANAQGFSLHAEVRCAMNQRHQLEQLCRYITRSAIANDRLKRNSAGDVVLQLKSPYHDGTTHIVMTPLGELKPKIL